MDSPEHSRNYVKRDIDHKSDVRSDRVGDDDEWESSDRRRHRSSKSKRPSGGEETEGLEGSGRRRSSGGVRNENRKRSGGGSCRADSDEDDYETRKELRSKQMKKKQGESSLEKLSSWYQDGELENRQSREKSVSRGQGRPDESEKWKMTSKISEHESSRSGSKSKEDRSHDGEHDKSQDRDSKYSERRESNRAKVHGSTEQGRNSRRRWDESESARKLDENQTDVKSGRAVDSMYESYKDRSYTRHEVSNSKSKNLDSHSEKGIKTSYKDERRVDVDRIKTKSRSEAVDEDNKGSPITREDRSGREKNEKHRQQRTPISRDVAESCEMFTNVDEDGSTRTRDKSIGGRSNRSRTPDKSSRRHQDSQRSETEYERSIDMRRKDVEKDGSRGDRSKGRDDWSDRIRDRETSKGLRRQSSANDRESKDGDIVYDRGRDWEPRHSRDRNDNERPHGRSRGEAVKTSSKFGISNDNYDVIEIQTKPLDYERAESASQFSRRSEASQLSNVKSAANAEDWAHMRDERGRRHDSYSSALSVEDKERYIDDNASMRDPSPWRDEMDYQGGKGRGQKSSVSGRGIGAQGSSTGSQPRYGNQELGSSTRAPMQGLKGSRIGRGGRGRPTGRDNQQVGPPLPMMGSPFGPLGMPPPGAMQPLGPGMIPAPGPPIAPGVFIPPFSPPVVWPGARGVEMNMLGVPPALSPVPPGPSAARFPPNVGTPSNHAMFFNQVGRGGPPTMSGPGFNPTGPIGHGTQPDKSPTGWVPPRTGGPPGKAPSRGEQNDYSQNFVDSGMRPQNFIRELELTNVVEDYPKLRELIQKKDEIVTKSASPPMYLKCDLKEFELYPEFFGTKFDVILVDPPWEEYVHRAPGVADHTEYWTFDEILNLKIEAIADTPSFIFLWVGDGVGLEQGRQCLKKWGFRRCEDICWVKTNKANAAPGLRHDSHTLFQHSKEHCLMGIKGTVRRSTDGHIIHANIDTDVIIAEEPPYGSTQKPEDMYRIIEHFSLGRRRLEIFGEDHNIRSGWLTIGKGLSSSNFNTEAYVRNFADKDGKVWQGGGGRNPPQDASHLVLTTPEIEALRPRSPMKNQQQSNLTPLNAASSSNRRPTGNSPQNPTTFSLNQEASSSNPSTPVPWASPLRGFRVREGVNITSEKVFDVYGFGGPANGDCFDFESHRQMNVL